MHNSEIEFDHKVKTSILFQATKYKIAIKKPSQSFSRSPYGAFPCIQNADLAFKPSVIFYSIHFMYGFLKPADFFSHSMIKFTYIRLYIQYRRLIQNINIFNIKKVFVNHIKTNNRKADRIRPRRRTRSKNTVRMVIQKWLYD